MRIPYYHVDAFTSKVFHGNPAGVCPLDQWLPDSVLQSIAAENNLSETAFFVRENGTVRLRWFTSAVEVDLCGHATVASAHILFSELNHAGVTIEFQTRSGLVKATRVEALIELDFPARPPSPCAASDLLLRGLGRPPSATAKSRDYVAIYESAAEVAGLNPDFEALRQLDCLGIIATAPGDDCDFVSRFFAPAAGILEDPVTGSSHCTLIPFWAGRLGKRHLKARQLSRRGGELYCRAEGERVAIAGGAVTYSRGFLEVPGS